MTDMISNIPFPQFKTTGDDKHDVEVYVDDVIDYCIMQNWFDPSKETEATKWTKPEKVMACLRATLSPAARAVYKYSLGLSEQDQSKPHMVCTWQNEEVSREGGREGGSPMHIDLDLSVTPVHAPTRRVPVAKLDKVNEELGRLCEEGIIRPVTQPTDWLSNMLVKEKPNGKLRICIDPSQTINKAIKRPKYTIPTIEERLPLLTKAKVFTIADVSEAFHTIELDEDSSLLTTFRGLDGHYCYNRMPFGIASGPEEYQRQQHEFLDGLNGVINITDDICVYGCGDTKEQADNY